MTQFAIIDPKLLIRENRHGAPFCVTQGEIWSRSAFPDGFGQFIVYSEVSAGAELRWDEHHGDEGVFIIDLAGVPFCDSTGINALVRIRMHCDSTGRLLTLTNLGPEVHRVLVELTGLGQYLNVQQPHLEPHSG